MEVRSWVASGGDLTGDKISDLVIGDPGFDQGRGRLLVYPGGKGGLAAKPAFVIGGSHPHAKLGDWIQIVGDINGDGSDDLMVSEFREHPFNGETGNQETFFLFLGGHLDSSPMNTFLDHTCVGAGDINGDGFDDVVTFGRNDMVRVFLGTSSGLSSQPQCVIAAEQSGSSFGALVAGAGDVNGDGFADVLVSAPKFSGRLQSSGKVYLYRGSRAGLETHQAWSAEYDLPITANVDDPHEQDFGFGLSTAGDVNGDGFDDVLIGARFAEQRDRNEGLAFLFLGAQSGLSTRPVWTAEGNQPHALFGSSLAGVHDLNGDGYDDVMIGVPEFSNGQVNEGAVAIYSGSQSALARRPSWSMEGDHSHYHLGNGVLSAGDLNGDGYHDVVIIALVGPTVVGSGGPSSFGRVVAAFGGPKGLVPSHSLTFDKPWLTALQQEVEVYRLRYGSAVYWAPPAIMVIATILSLSVALQRARRHVALLTEAGRDQIRDEERTRIMRDVHDALGADLTQIISEVRAAQSAIGSDQSAAQWLVKLDASANEAVETIDELVWLLNPASDRLCSFVDAAGEYAVRFLETHNISCHLKFPDQDTERHLNAKTRHCLHLVLKEALHNVVKHAHAKRVQVSLCVNADTLVLSIQDDGCGMRAACVAPEGPASSIHLGPKGAGLGIASLRTRVAELAGTVDLQSIPGGGTTVRCQIPWKS